MDDGGRWWGVVGRTEAFESYAFGIKSFLVICPTEICTDELRKKVYSSTLHNDPHLETTQISINSRMDTASVHSYNGLLYSRVNSRPLHGTNMDYSYTVEPMKPDTKEYIQHDSMCRQLVEFIYGTDL